MTREVDDRLSIGGTLACLGDIALCQKDFPRAAALFEESLRLRPIQNAVLHQQGALACYQGDYERAATLCDKGLNEMRGLHWPHGIATVLHSLGDVALFRDDSEQAWVQFGESLRLFSEIANQQRAVWCLGSLAALDAVVGYAVRAVTVGSAAEVIHAAIGSPRRRWTGRGSRGSG